MGVKICILGVDVDSQEEVQEKYMDHHERKGGDPLLLAWLSTSSH